MHFILEEIKSMKLIKNIGILAHVDAGKTTLTEQLLYHSGSVQNVGRVDLGTTTTDSMELEKERGITIRANSASLTWNGQKVNLIDTPGHMDFITEVERIFGILEGAILVLSAKPSRASRISFGGIVIRSLSFIFSSSHINFLVSILQIIKTYPLL